ncbi:hypothetical protein ACROYT_G004190 [Oculina patagonica]
MGIADVVNPRLQPLMMKMLLYSFTAEWVKVHLAEDALSRFPVDQPSLDDEICNIHSEAAVKIPFADTDSNGGSQFTCKAFEDFSQEWGFRYTVSSPIHAQSNGKAEAAVTNVKKLLE